MICSKQVIKLAFGHPSPINQTAIEYYFSSPSWCSSNHWPVINVPRCSQSFPIEFLRSILDQLEDPNIFFPKLEDESFGASRSWARYARARKSNEEKKKSGNGQPQFSCSSSPHMHLRINQAGSAPLFCQDKRKWRKRAIRFQSLMLCYSNQNNQARQKRITSQGNGE